jgi:hypothetical protein
MLTDPVALHVGAVGEARCVRLLMAGLPITGLPYGGMYSKASSAGGEVARSDGAFSTRAGLGLSQYRHQDDENKHQVVAHCKSSLDCYDPRS